MLGTNIEGRVNLEAVIGVDGTVRTMRTVDATNPDFEQSAHGRRSPVALHADTADLRAHRGDHEGPGDVQARGSRPATAAAATAAATTTATTASGRTLIANC